jgi:hypothetical protein
VFGVGIAWKRGGSSPWLKTIGGMQMRSRAQKQILPPPLPPLPGDLLWRAAAQA